jgi:hypothetical protein
MRTLGLKEKGGRKRKRKMEKGQKVSMLDPDRSLKIRISQVGGYLS